MRQGVPTAVHRHLPVSEIAAKNVRGPSNAKGALAVPAVVARLVLVAKVVLVVKPVLVAAALSSLTAMAMVSLTLRIIVLTKQMKIRMTKMVTALVMPAIFRMMVMQTWMAS
jgi:hypothetical protein